MPVPARRLPSWAWVTGLTAGAVAAVAALAVQADHGPKPAAVSTRPNARASASPGARPAPTPTMVKVPDGSGTGRRIVYSLGSKRVWLIDASDAQRRTFTVWPGTVSPEPGTYTVSSRRETTTGFDGVPVEHIVYFTARSGLSIAFSNALDGSSPPAPTPGARTGGIRMGEPDGQALWAFATTGTTVAVVA
ncbi:MULTISPECIES: L,D-transpeptidase [unclassified Streptomyces]|uniref:L,D-transpeptidase n=1 Tax=unclassified Streptomyces TaxID=2593676 RepID=UPI001F040EAD|nr:MULTISPECIES: L,D-transpeptidase [unclassified Streptomyces]MCH0562084.1 L,D-transpeptidase [Streptomyces sp. MUM 2J]MCH0568089.1 L,D-transpeptidase [Streptomyces sp. MUM 136J]